MTIRPELAYVGSVTLVAVQDSATIVLSAFRTSDFEPLWTGYPIGAGAIVGGCDNVLCIDDGSGVVERVDPILGAKLGAEPGAPAGGTRAAVSFVARFGIHEIVVVPPGQTPAVQSLPVTIDFESVIASGHGAPTPEWSAGVAGELWIGEQVATGTETEVRTLGVLRDVPEACIAIQSDALHRYVACATALHQLSLWQVG